MFDIKCSTMQYLFSAMFFTFYGVTPPSPSLLALWQNCRIFTWFKITSKNACKKKKNEKRESRLLQHETL